MVLHFSFEERAVDLSDEFLFRRILKRMSASQADGAAREAGEISDLKNLLRDLVGADNQQPGCGDFCEHFLVARFPAWRIPVESGYLGFTADRVCGRISPAPRPRA